MVTQIAHDKTRTRFQPRPAGAEIPREVFVAAAEDLAASLSTGGWRFAKSGPHITRRDGVVTTKAHFASSTLNVADELVALRVSFLIADRSHAAWRRGHEQPLRGDNIVATRHLGHLLEPPRWLEWNLADLDSRSATINDVRVTLAAAIESYVNPLTQLLQSHSRPGELAGLVDDPSLIEYFVRHDLSDQTAPVIDAIIGRFAERGRQNFMTLVERYRSEGLPEAKPTGVPGAIAYLVAQFDLPLAP
ncbi:MAG: hypothetical protein GY701_25790 [Sulfitobacter sp.]|nr:hypothetical protein [Sulfitobacter sp.]